MKFSDDTGRLKVDLGNSAWRSVPILGNMAYQRDSGYFESIAVLLPVCFLNTVCSFNVDLGYSGSAV